MKLQLVSTSPSISCSCMVEIADLNPAVVIDWPESEKEASSGIRAIWLWSSLQYSSNFEKSFCPRGLSLVLLCLDESCEAADSIQLGTLSAGLVDGSICRMFWWSPLAMSEPSPSTTELCKAEVICRVVAQYRHIQIDNVVGFGRG